MVKFLFLFSFLLCLCQCGLNAAERPTWQSADYKQFFSTGLKIPANWRLNARFQSAIIKGQSLPTSYDLRTKGISPVELQGSCGSCWAFSAVKTLQDAYWLNGEKINASEQYLVSCNPWGWGCQGGWWAHDMHLPPKGGVIESEFPYVAQDVQCKGGLTYRYPIESWSYLSSGQDGIPSIEEIKSAIYNYGTISVAVAADSAFQSYSSGIFNSCESTSLNHAVNLVGWDDAGQYWIMENSWGTNWGERGFMRIKWNCNMIGYSANFIKYKQNPNPNPDPNPDPNPTPTPDPDPNPDPDPGPPPALPCIYHNVGPDVSARRGTTIIIGSKPQDGAYYQWYKNRELLEDWNSSLMRIKLSNTPGIRIYESIAYTKDGCIDSDKIRIYVR
jgi:hypothetical protein